MNLSKKTLQSSLREATFDPRKPGPLSAIVAGKDVAYLIRRSAEPLSDALDAAASPKERAAKLRDAIAMLAYAHALLDREAKTNARVFAERRITF